MEIIRPPEKVYEDIQKRGESARALPLLFSGLLLYLGCELIDGDDFGPLDVLKMTGVGMAAGGMWGARRYLLGPSFERLVDEYYNGRSSDDAQKVN